MSTGKIISTAEAWESGQLGRDEAHARRAPEALERQIDESLGLQMISIRLPKELIEGYKKAADAQGVGYRSLIREVLARSLEAELEKPAVHSANSKPAERIAESN